MFKGRPFSKVVAVFRQPEAAELARDQVKSAAGLDDGQVRIVGPNTPWVRQPDPPRESIARAALRMQLTSVLAGLALAMAAWLVLYGLDVDVIAATPVPSLVAIALIGTMLGLVVGGTLSLGEHDGSAREGSPGGTNRSLGRCRAATVARATRARAGHPAGDRRTGRAELLTAHGSSSVAPVVCRPCSARCASAAFDSGKVWWTSALTLPARIRSNISVDIAIICSRVFA
jgi:hypothetical protein